MSNFNEAAEALAAAAQAADSSQPTENAPSIDPGSEPASTEVPSSQIDISQLPAEAQEWIRAREREMTGDYTRKTQELSEQRREMEQINQFYQAINTDPQFAYDVMQELQKSLSATGFIQVDEPPVVDEWGQPVESESQQDPYANELSEIKNWIAAQEQHQLEFQAEAHINNQLATLKNQNPNYSEDDFKAIVDLGFSTGGDLYKADEAYKALRQRIVGGYVDGKSSVTVSAPLPSSTGSGVVEAPQGDKELRAAALEMMRNQLGA